MKPYLHAESSAKKFGGVPNDYLKIHCWFDQTKAHFPDNRHRAVTHHTQGIFEAERIFGITFENSDKKIISTRDIGEQHVLEDLGFIPTLSDYLYQMTYQNWMHGDGRPNFTPVIHINPPNLTPFSPNVVPASPHAPPYTIRDVTITD